VAIQDDNSGNITDLSNTYDNFHEYEIQWTPDEIKWLVDGKVGRTKKRSETWNETSNQWAFPQTPSRVQISIWPGGAETNAEGTINWAGGKIDWNSDEIKNYGYYFATFSEVTVECYKTNSPPGTNKGVSYYYNNIAGTNDTVVDSNKPTVLKSLLGTGTDMDKGGDNSTDAAETSGVHNVPGGSSSPANVPGSGSNSGGSDSGSSGSSSSGSTQSCDTKSFSQNCGSSGTSGNSNDGVRGADRTLGASAFAVIIGIAGLLFL
jgi:beta-glucanase (GH16 family)